MKLYIVLGYYILLISNPPLKMSTSSSRSVSPRSPHTVSVSHDSPNKLPPLKITSTEPVSPNQVDFTKVDSLSPGRKVVLAPLNIPRNTSFQNVDEVPVQRIAKLKKLRPLSPSDSISSFSGHNLLKKALSPKPSSFQDLFESCSEDSSSVDLAAVSKSSSRLSSPGLPPLVKPRTMNRVISDISLDSMVDNNSSELFLEDF